MPQALPLLVHCSVKTAEIVGNRLLKADPTLIETVQLLGSGEGMLLLDNGPILTRWVG